MFKDTWTFMLPWGTCLNPSCFNNVHAHFLHFPVLLHFQNPGLLWQQDMFQEPQPDEKGSLHASPKLKSSFLEGEGFCRFFGGFRAVGMVMGKKIQSVLWPFYYVCQASERQIQVIFFPFHIGGENVMHKTGCLGSQPAVLKVEVIDVTKPACKCHKFLRFLMQKWFWSATADGSQCKLYQ